jgi:ABC-type sugar transport system substrate-binding protein
MATTAGFAALGLMLLSACSSTKTSSGAAGSTGAPSTPTSAAGAVSSSDLTNTVERAFYGPMSSAQLGPVITATLEQAAKPLTDAQTAAALRCFKETRCHVGNGKYTLGILEATPANPYTDQWDAEAIVQAVTYPQIGTIIHLNSNGDLATSQSDFRSLVAQKANIITGNFSFGASMGPEARQASSQGVLVIPANEPIPGATSPTEEATFVGQDYCHQYSSAAQTLGSAVKSGTVALVTGVAGNTNAAAWQPCAAGVLTKAGIHIEKSFFTNWTPQGEQSVATAMISSGQSFAGVMYDYTPEALIAGFQSANKPVPTVYAATPDSATAALVSKGQTDGKPVVVYTSSPSVWDGRIAVTAGLMRLGGTELPQQILMPMTTAPISNLLKFWNASLPASSTLGSLLPPSLVTAAISSNA